MGCRAVGCIVGLRAEGLVTLLLGHGRDVGCGVSATGRKAFVAAGAFLAAATTEFTGAGAAAVLGALGASVPFSMLLPGGPEPCIARL